MAKGGAEEKNLLKSSSLFLFLGRFTISCLIYSGIYFMLSTSGISMNEQITDIWFLGHVPVRKGFLSNISAKIHPTFHKSADFV